jgi:magnesium chelatase subunit D
VSVADDGWTDAWLAAALVAADPAGLGGVRLRGPADPRREAWLATLATLLPAATVPRRVPHHVTDGRLLGEIDLVATLAAGRPVAARGILAAADGGVVVVAMAERLAPRTAAHLAHALDWHEVCVEREGLTARTAAAIGVVALDEGEGIEEVPPPALLERLALHVEIGALGRSPPPAPLTRADVATARARLAATRIGERQVRELAATAAVLGIGSLRAVVLAARAARVIAALDGRRRVTSPDAAAAARLVLAPRATRLPAPPGESPEPAPSQPPADAPPERAADGSPDPRTASQAPLADVVLEAAIAAIPPGLLALLGSGPLPRTRAPAAGRAGVAQAGGVRGRPAGVRRGAPRGEARLSLIDTLRAAAPWQRLRRGSTAGDQRRIDVRRDDLHVRRFKPRTETTTIFVVDASGSAAMHRLAEAKGAVELLLADCYVRRDRVALISFRGSRAELVLAPTRSLVRAKRCLAGLPGGGGTPLAAALDAAVELAAAVQRRGGTPSVVILSDGRANVGRDGTQGRTRAEQDARAASRRARAARLATLFIDTAQRPQRIAAELAAEMRARYLPLPHADAHALSRAARAVTPA